MRARPSLKALCERVNALETRHGLNRSRQAIMVYGPSRQEADANYAEYLERNPAEADRPVRLIVTWSARCDDMSGKLWWRETERGTFVARAKTFTDNQMEAT